MVPYIHIYTYIWPKGLQAALCVYILIFTCVPSLPCGACAKPKTAAIVSKSQHMSAYVRTRPCGAEVHNC